MDEEDESEEDNKEKKQFALERKDNNNYNKRKTICYNSLHIKIYDQCLKITTMFVVVIIGSWEVISRARISRPYNCRCSPPNPVVLGNLFTFLLVFLGQSGKTPSNLPYLFMSAIFWVGRNVEVLIEYKKLTIILLVAHLLNKIIVNFL